MHDNYVYPRTLMQLTETLNKSILR